MRRMRLSQVTNRWQAIIGKPFKIGNVTNGTLLVENNREAAVSQMLLDTGKFDINEKDSNSRTPLFIASGNAYLLSGSCSCLRLEKPTSTERDLYGQTPLLQATKNGCDAMVKMLLDTGEADINLKDKNGKTPLLLASENGWSIVRLLLKTRNCHVDTKSCTVAGHYRYSIMWFLGMDMCLLTDSSLRLLELEMSMSM
jgi:ankyrin repeat protein